MILIHIFNKKKISKAVLVLVYTGMHNFLKKTHLNVFQL